MSVKPWDRDLLAKPAMRFGGAAAGVGRGHARLLQQGGLDRRHGPRRRRLRMQLTQLRTAPSASPAARGRGLAAARLGAAGRWRRGRDRRRRGAAARRCRGAHAGSAELAVRGLGTVLHRARPRHDPRARSPDSRGCSPDGQTFSAQFGLDLMTGASPSGALPSSQAQTITSPSGSVTTIPAGTRPTHMFEDTRGSLDLEWVRAHGRVVLDHARRALLARAGLSIRRRHRDVLARCGPPAHDVHRRRRLQQRLGVPGGRCPRRHGTGRRTRRRHARPRARAGRRR